MVLDDDVVSRYIGKTGPRYPTPGRSQLQRSGRRHMHDLQRRGHIRGSCKQLGPKVMMSPRQNVRWLKAGNAAYATKRMDEWLGIYVAWGCPGLASPLLRLWSRCTTCAGWDSPQAVTSPYENCARRPRPQCASHSEAHFSDSTEYKCLPRKPTGRYTWYEVRSASYMRAQKMAPLTNTVPGGGRRSEDKSNKLCPAR